MQNQSNRSTGLTISKRCLWGYNLDQMNPNDPVDSVTIIGRVFDAGTYEDIQQVIAYYGTEKVKQALTTSPELQGQTITFSALLFGIEPVQFQSFRKRSSEDIKYHSF